MKKVLLIDEWVPSPLDSGKKIRTYNLIKNLSADFKITLMCYANEHDTDNIKEIEKINVKILPVRDTRLKKWTIPFYSRVFINLFENVPFSTIYHIKPAFQDKLYTYIAEEQPDIIHCEWTNLSPFLERCDLSKTVISSHNIESDIWRRLAQQSNNPFTKILAHNQKRKIEILEKYWYPKAACCTAVSQKDFDTIKGYGGNCWLIENGVDVKYYSEFDSNQVTRGNTIVFTASYDSFSNEDGALFFMREHWKSLKDRLHDAQLIFVGKKPTKRMLEAAANDPTIQFTGWVPDVRPFIARAKVCIVPLRIGGGSRLKIFEAMAMKKAIVSTSIGAEGINIKNDSEILIADDPKNFVDAIIKLCAFENLRKNIAVNAYNYIYSSYDWSALAEKQKMAWLSISS